MRRAARAALPALLLSAAAPAAAFVRTNSCPNDANAGYDLWWGGYPPTLGFALSTAHVPAGCASGSIDALESLVTASVGTWAAPSCTSLQVAYAGRQADPVKGMAVGVVDGQNLVVFRTRTCGAPDNAAPAGAPCLTQGGCGNLYDCWEDAGAAGTLALTIVSYDTGSGRIADADMELWDWNGSLTAPTGHYYTCATGTACPSPPYGKQGCVYWDVGSVVTHEAGHMLGLDHVTGVRAVMNPTLAPGYTDMRSLQPDDVDGICSIYPSGQAATQQKLAGSCVETRRSCGCGGEPASLLWALLPPLLLRRRGRAGESPSPTS